MNVASGSEAGFITRKLVVSWVNRFDLLHVCAPISEKSFHPEVVFCFYSGRHLSFFLGDVRAQQQRTSTLPLDIKEKNKEKKRKKNV